MTHRLLLKDQPISDDQADELGHKDIAVLLSRILTDWMDDKTPLHLALYGPWGGGKSGIIALLKNQIKQNESLKGSVKLIDFSLWQFGADNVRRGLLLFLDGPGGFDTNCGISARLSETSARTELKTRLNWGALWKWLTLSILFLVLAVTVKSLIQIPANYRVALGSVLDFAGILAALGAVLQQIAGNVLRTQISEGSTTPPPDRPDQFKAEFEKLLEAARTKTRKTWTGKQKLVLVLDDLDRVPPSVAWDVLTTIKTFLDAPHCVYILPCDRHAVVEAIGKSSGPAIEARAVDFLDKFFQVSFTLPETYPRQLRAISDALCGELGLSKEVSVIAVAGFYNTPRALKIFLNQVSLFSEFILIRNDRLGDPGSAATNILNVAKVHAIRVLWPKCGMKIRDVNGVMATLEGLVQGVAAPTEVLNDVTAVMIRENPGLWGFLEATMGIAVGPEGQAASRLSEAIWQDARVNLNSVATWFSTAASSSLEELLADDNEQAFLNVCRDAFNAEKQQGSKDALVSWTGVLLNTFVAGQASPRAAIVELAIDWLTDSAVRDSIGKLPPEPIVRSVASTKNWMAAGLATTFIDRIFGDSSSPFNPYIASLIRAISINGNGLELNHSSVGIVFRKKLVELITGDRSRALQVLALLQDKATSNDWAMWWDGTVGTAFLETVTDSSNEPVLIAEYLCRDGYSPADSERRAATASAIKLLASSHGNGSDAQAMFSLRLIEGVALNGSTISLLSLDNIDSLSNFIQSLGDVDTRARFLSTSLRLLTGEGADQRKRFLEGALVPSLQFLGKDQVSALLVLSEEASLLVERGWTAAFLERALHLRDASLFKDIVRRASDSEATDKWLEAAVAADQSFVDQVIPLLEESIPPLSLAKPIELRARQATTTNSLATFVTMVQQLKSQPMLAKEVWHSITMQIEFSTLDASDESQAAAFRSVLTARLLDWLPKADQAHLSDYAVAIAASALTDSVDTPERTQAKVETAAVLSNSANHAQQIQIANSIAHVVARPKIPPAVLSALVNSLERSNGLLRRLIDEDAWATIALTHEARNDEGKAFLDSLLVNRPSRPHSNTRRRRGS